MNPEGLPFFINPSVLWPPPLYFALQNTPQCYGTRQRRRVRCISLSLLSDSICDTPQYYGARQGRSLKVTLYSYRLSHNNGERRGKIFCEKRLFCYLSSAKGGKNYGETSIFRLGFEFGE